MRTLALVIGLGTGCGFHGSAGPGATSDASTGGSGGEGGIDAAPSDVLADADPPRPARPPELMDWIVGNPADRVTTSQGGFILMGGGTDVDAAFTWQRDRIGGGDVVVLRTSQADGYNDYLYTTIGGVDSVETMLVNSRALANDPYVRWTIDHAEAIFIAGGDQATYVASWQGTALATAIDAAARRGAVTGGTSAGCAVLGAVVYSAEMGSVYSTEALANPYDPRVTLRRDMFSLPNLSNVVTDPHFATRDRMGRLLAFTARAIADGWTTHPLGLGIDEQTALVVDPQGLATVVGSGSVYAVEPGAAPATCSPSTPLAWSGVPLVTLTAGATIALPAGTAQGSHRTLSAGAGALTPANPY